MSGVEAEPPEDPLADALAAYDDRLAAGITRPHDELDQAVDPALASDWNRLTAFLSLVEKAWPRAGPDSENLTISDADRQTEPTPTQGPPLLEDLETRTPDAGHDRRFGRFQILRTLGRGGFGIVFLAWDPALRRQVALKVPQPETLLTPEARKRFQREAQAAAGLDHTNIIPVYETGSVGSVTYIAAAYCSGPTLADWLARQRHPVPPRDAATLTAALAKAVEHAHERGVLHRDLKPSNILLQHAAADDPTDDANESLGAFEPRITDFSLAKIADGLGPDTKSGVPFGSPPYMAPEQAEGKLKAIGPPTDVYGLGCILYELLAGSPPFCGDGQLDILRKVIADAPIPLRRLRKDTPDELEAVVLKCLEKDPARRYPCARGLADDLERFLADLPTKARPAGILSGTWRWVQCPQRIREAGIIAIGYAVIAILWLIYGAVFVRLALVFHLARPAEFYRDALIVTFGDFIPALWLGWKIKDRRLWAIWAGLATGIVRICLTTGGLFGMPPRFGGLYDNIMMRIAIYVALVNLATIVLVSNLMALIAYYANANTRRSVGYLAGWHRPSSSNRSIAPPVADDLFSIAAVEPERAGPRGRSAKLRQKARRQPAVLVVLLIVLAFTVGISGIGYWYQAQLDKSTNVVRQREDEARLGALAVRQAHYVADVRQTAVYISRFQPRNAVDLLMRQLPKPGEDDLREFSWHHLLKRCHTERRTLTGHRGEVYYVEFSSRGDLLASAGKDGTVRLWNTTTWQHVRTISASLTEVNVATFSPDGKTIATIDDDGKLKLWETATGQCQFEQVAHSGNGAMVQFTPDGKSIVTAGRTDSSAKIWDVRSGQALETFAANGAILSGDGSMLAILAAAEVQLWNVNTRSLIGSFAGGRGIAGGAFSHDGTRIATADEADRWIRLWDVRTQRMIHEFHGHTEGATAVAFSYDDQTIISAGDDHTIRFWDVATGQPRRVHLGHAARIWNLAASPDGATIASAGRDGSVKLWDLEVPGDYFKLPVVEPISFGFEPDSRTLLTMEAMNGLCIARWDARTGALIGRIPLDMSGRGCATSAFSNNGRVLATADSSGSVMLWDTTTGRRQGGVDVAPAFGNYLEFSPDGRYLLMEDPNRQHKIWDIEVRRLISVPETRLAPGRKGPGVTFAPSGELVVLQHDLSLVRWNPSSGQTRQILPGRRHYMDHFVISSDGRLLAADEPMNPHMYILSADTGERHKDLAGHAGGDTRPRAFSPDGMSFVSSGADRTVKIWDVATSEELLTLEGFSGPVQSCRFSPDGTILATLSSGAPGNHAEIFLWRAALDEPESAAPAR